MKSLWGQGNRYLRVNRKNIEVSPHFAKLVFAGLIVLLAMIFVAGDVGLWNLWRAQNRLEKIRGDITRLETETQYLRIQNKALKTDPFAIEKVARERYGYLRSGEKVFRIITLPSGEESSKFIPSSLDIDRSGR